MFKFILVDLLNPIMVTEMVAGYLSRIFKAT